MGSCGRDSRQRYSREEEYCLLDYFPHKQLLIADFYTSKHLRRGVPSSGRFCKPAGRPQLLMSHQWRTFNVRREYRSHFKRIENGGPSASDENAGATSREDLQPQM